MFFLRKKSLFEAQILILSLCLILFQISLAQQFQKKTYNIHQGSQNQNSNIEDENVKYDDDDPIEITIKTNKDPLTEKEVKQINNIRDKIHFSIHSLYNKLIKSNKQQMIPSMIKLTADDIFEFESENEENLSFRNEKRPGIDLIFLIDKSGSMSGSKIELLKQVLSYVLTLLNENDRVSLISFDSTAKRLTPLLKMTEDNIKKLQLIIKEMYGFGGTNFFDPIQKALKQVQDRKYQNELTSIFMLSDGQVYGSDHEELVIKSNEQFVLHTFGIGSDHNPDLLKNLAEIKQGNFYYIEDMKLVDEYFANALGGIISIIGKNFTITFKFKELPNQFQASINSTYSTFWSQNKNKEYQIHLNNLLSGTSKNFMFDLELPQLNDIKESSILILDAYLEFSDIHEKTIIKKQATLEINLAQGDEKISYSSEDNLNEEVYINQERIKVAEIMEKALNLAMLGEYDQAKKQISEKIEQLENIPFLKNNESLKILISELEEAKTKCTDTNYNIDGNIWLKQRTYMHQNQQGSGFLSDTMNEGYSNSIQRSMTKRFIKKKIKK